MNLTLSEEHNAIIEMAKKYAISELAPVADRLDINVNKDDDRALFLNNLQGLAELGFMGMNVRTQYGGSEVGTVAFSLAITEIARACASTAVTMSVNNMVGEVIQAIASEKQKHEYLPKLCSGIYSAGSFCLSEVSAGSDPAGIKTRAVKDGDQWILNGTKMWVSSAEYAGIFIVWAVTDSKAPKGKGISCFLVEADSPGITIAKAENKMGQNASSTNQVIFEDCRIPKSALMGKLNDGFSIAMRELAGGRIGVGSLALGIGLAAMDYSRQYTVEREQFGSSIASMQGPQWMMADAYTQLEASRLLLMSAASNKERGVTFSKQASMAKLHATETANQACYTAIQLMGGLGYTKDVPLERFARDARVTSIYEGTSEIQRIIIARELLSEIQ
jgi:alkylation response protein AidB-like acyl-CoA dehydrogenase